MKVQLTRAEIGLLRLALLLAIGDEESLIDSYTSQRTGKSIEPKVTRATKSRIARMRRLRVKLHETICTPPRSRP